MTERYWVRVEKAYLNFPAAHFITFDNDQCERLHGHNYRMAVEVEGPLDKDALVIDFIALKRICRALLEPLDHRVLLATRHPTIRVEAGETEVTVTACTKRYILPRGDCALLDIANTTAEQLAWMLAGQLEQRLADETKTKPTRIQVEVEESVGQRAVYVREGV